MTTWINTRTYGTGRIIRRFTDYDGVLTMLAVFPGYGRQFVRPMHRADFFDFGFSLN